jgi:glycosyltransferase involved in cell wall biosynthesis
MDIRDWWMLEFEERSPFREFFNWAIMPTVDAAPQHSTWMDTYSTADGVFAYSEFGRDTMLEQSRNINFINVASPCASDIFFPVEDKEKLREELGLKKDIIIFGTVMRNQRRKLYPDLFKAFRLFLDQNSELNNVYLYCHTGYPDVGWEIPDLIKQYGLGNKVLMTYKCRKCGTVKPLFFNDAVVFCNQCMTFASTLVGVGNRMDDTDLNKIYNLFDVYIQWANSEGWGMPQLEAAYAGLPVISVNYSAMESLVHNIEGIPVDPIGFYKELETGCMRAVPDNQKLADIMTSLCDSDYRKSKAETCYLNAKKIYNWDYTADKWLDYFLKTPVKDVQQTWDSPPRFFNPATAMPENIEEMPYTDQVNWLFMNVLGKPEWINKSIWKKMIKDLTYRASVSSAIPGYYYNDYSHPDMERKLEEFTFKKAYEACFNMRNAFNQWEQLRSQRIGQ